MIAPDETTFAYLKDSRTRRRASTGKPRSSTGTSLATDDDATFDREVVLDAEELAPFVTWGTNPGQGAAAVGQRADPARLRRPRTTGPRPSGRWSTWA